MIVPTKIRVAGVCFFFVLGIALAGCASRTGRGTFPSFSIQNPSSKSLMVLPPIDLEAEDLRSSILVHADVERLSQHFQTSFIVPSDTAAQLLSDNFSGQQITTRESKILRNAVDADLLLGFYVHEFGIQEYNTTETRTLFRTSSSRENSSVRQNADIDFDNRDDEVEVSRSIRSSATGRSSDVSSQEIPVRTGKIRVTLSLSALVYDVNDGKIIWRGRRIERAENDMEDLSTIELKDIVVERVLYRIVSRLTY